MASTSLLKEVSACYLVLQSAMVKDSGLTMMDIAEFIHNSLLFSQNKINAVVRLRCYKGSVSILSRSSDEKLYDPTAASMDSLVDFSPVDTSKSLDFYVV